MEMQDNYFPKEKAYLLGKNGSRGRIVSQNPKMIELFEFIDLLATKDIPILIGGETGTGKELVARALHYNGLRDSGEFVAVNCGALVDSLYVAELNGVEKGAYTGAGGARKGYLEEAEKGTVYLDEISSMPLNQQAALLRLIENKEFTPVGSAKSRKSDTRVVLSSNEDILKFVQRGEFRKDLYHRINTFEVNLPPLRERKSDIRILAKHFLSGYSGDSEGELTFSEEAFKYLEKYDWPGNVRELERTVQAVSLIVDSYGKPVIEKKFLERFLGRGRARIESPLLLEEIKRRAIIEALERNDWNKTRAARELGIGRATMWRKILDYKIERQ